VILPEELIYFAVFTLPSSCAEGQAPLWKLHWGVATCFNVNAAYTNPMEATRHMDGDWKDAASGKVQPDHTNLLPNLALTYNTMKPPGNGAEKQQQERVIATHLVGTIYLS